jgi:hypothetical protein
MMPPITRVINVVVRGQALVNQLRTQEDIICEKGIVLNGQRFTKADLQSILARLSAIEARLP